MKAPAQVFSLPPRECHFAVDQELSHASLLPLLESQDDPFLLVRVRKLRFRETE